MQHNSNSWGRQQRVAELGKARKSARRQEESARPASGRQSIVIREGALKFPQGYFVQHTWGFLSIHGRSAMPLPAAISHIFFVSRSRLVRQGGNFPRAFNLKRGLENIAVNKRCHIRKETDILINISSMNHGKSHRKMRRKDLATVRSISVAKVPR